MAALSRHRPRPLATYTQVSQRSKYQYIRMKDMIRSALGTPPGGGMFSGMTPGGDGMGGNRGLTLGMMGAPPSSATAENFPSSGGGMSNFGTPLSAGLDNHMGGSRRPSTMGMANGGNGPRQILPGQLPGPGPNQRKSSLSVGGS
jgi:SAGA-associated factor 73